MWNVGAGKPENVVRAPPPRAGLFKGTKEESERGRLPGQGGDWGNEVWHRRSTNHCGPDCRGCLLRAAMRESMVSAFSLAMSCACRL